MGKKKRLRQNKSQRGRKRGNNKKFFFREKEENNNLKEKDPEKNSNQLFEEKKIAIAFNKMNQIFNEEEIKNKSLLELKSIASKFDINPLINYKLLSFLKTQDKNEYDKYISKYKYTLNYSEAKILKCFTDNEKSIILENQKYFGKDITEINSLSKMKLFNFLFYLFNLKFDEEDSEQDFMKSVNKIKQEINSYIINDSLIFKIPNKFGNHELQYYTYLRLFVIHFSNLLEPIFNNYNNTLLIQQKENFFERDDNKEGKTEIINLSHIESRKKTLSEFIQDNYTKNEINNMNIEKGEKDNENNIPYRQEFCYYRFGNIISLFKKHKEELYYLFKEKNDDKIIKQIEFIYYSLLFTKETKNYDYEVYPFCLGNNPKNNNEFFNKRYLLYTNEELRKSFKKEDLALINVDYLFKINAKNPFYNNAKYFKFPILLKKNIFQTNPNIFFNFKKFLKHIYQSKLMQEIFYITPEFKDFKYPLLDEEILDEMIDNTIFIPFSQKVLLGYTQRQFGKIYVATYLTNKGTYTKNDLSKLILEISFFLCNIIQEQFNHYLKGLLFYNSFRFKINKRLESQKEQYYLDNISSIFTKNNFYKLYLGQALKMYYNKTWDLSVKDFLIEFNKNNKAVNKTITYSLKEIKENEKINDFIKEIIIQFNTIYKCNGEIKLDYNEYYSLKQKDNSLFNEDEIELDFSVYMERNKITIPDTETDLRLLNLFNQ